MNELEEITPVDLRCWPAHCPGVFRRPNGKLVIIGKRVHEAELGSRVGPGEEAIEIDAAFFPGFNPPRDHLADLRREAVDLCVKEDIIA